MDPRERMAEASKPLSQRIRQYEREMLMSKPYIHVDQIDTECYNSIRIYKGSPTTATFQLRYQGPLWSYGRRRTKPVDRNIIATVQIDLAEWEEIDKKVRSLLS